MSGRSGSIEAEIASIERKADQSCSIHAWIRDRNQRYAVILDYGLMGATTYLLGLSLVEPAIGLPLSLGFDRPILMSVLSLLAFFLSVVQFKNDWKGRAAAHHRAFREYAAIKSSCRAITSGVHAVTSAEHQRIRDRYDAVTDVGTHIPDSMFIKGKARHIRKIYVSKYLDRHPGARPLIVHIKLFLHHNFKMDLLGEDVN